MKGEASRRARRELNLVAADEVTLALLTIYIWAISDHAPRWSAVGLVVPSLNVNRQNGLEANTNFGTTAIWIDRRAFGRQILRFEVSRQPPIKHYDFH